MWISILVEFCFIFPPLPCSEAYSQAFWWFLLVGVRSAHVLFDLFSVLFFSLAGETSLVDFMHWQEDSLCFYAPHGFLNLHPNLHCGGPLGGTRRWKILGDYGSIAAPSWKHLPIGGVQALRLLSHARQHLKWWWVPRQPPLPLIGSSSVGGGEGKRSVCQTRSYPLNVFHAWCELFTRVSEDPVCSFD